MHKILIAVSALALCAGPAFAADDVMTGYYGNTVVATGGIAESHTHYKADHTFDLTATAMGQNYSFKGTWAIDAKGELCRTYADPAPPNTPNPLCTPFAAHKVGDTWTMTMNGNTRTLTLKAGIQ
jgi:hypothetical protein